MEKENGNTKLKHGEKIIVVMRHGERADLAGVKVMLNMNDPELTDEGKNQAFEAGKRLKVILDEYSKSDKKIAFISSPFSRCIMTAKYAKNGMDLDLPIYLEYGLSEFISKGWFKSSPSEFLCYQNGNIHLMNELMNEIIIDQTFNPLPEYPESTNSCLERFRTTLDVLLYHFGIRKDYDVLILVTHVFGLQTLCEKMKIPLDYFEIEYCSTFVFKYNPKTAHYSFEKNFYPTYY